MQLDKDQLRRVHRFFAVNTADLASFDEWAEFLDALLTEQCAVMELDGVLTLLEIKALVSRVKGMEIHIYSKEHSPPHFHVRSADVDAAFSIEDCSLLRGDVSSGDYAKIRYWHERAKPLLIEKWNSLRPTDCIVGPYKGN